LVDHIGKKIWIGLVRLKGKRKEYSTKHLQLLREIVTRYESGNHQNIFPFI